MPRVDLAIRADVGCKRIGCAANIPQAPQFREIGEDVIHDACCFDLATLRMHGALPFVQGDNLCQPRVCHAFTRSASDSTKLRALWSVTVLPS